MEPRGRRLVRFRGPDGRARVGAIEPDEPTRVVELVLEGPPGGLGANDVLVHLSRHANMLTQGEERRVVEALDPETLELPEPWQLLAPIVPPETWAAGVTYERSRDARLEETQVRDVYSLVYEAERPELFLKDAAGRRTVGPGGTLGVRSESTWTVPEPELALVLDEDGALLGATIANDVTARDVEGANPLYLPQAKLFAGSCALGPAILLPDDWSRPFEIEVRLWGADGTLAWEGATSTARMKRTFAELAAFTVRENPIPAGSVLLTGTGLVPPDEVALAPGCRVEVRISGIGKLSNPVGAAVDLLPRRSESHVS